MSRNGQYRAYLIENHWCVECQGQDARTLTGKPLCFECLEKKREKSRAISDDAEYIAAMRTRKKELREKRKAQGLCTSCGAELPKRAYPYLLCPKCRARGKEKSRKQREARGVMTRAELAEKGICTICGKNPVMVGEGSFSGRPLRVCEGCYRKQVESLTLARAAYLEKHGDTWGNIQLKRELVRNDHPV